jgi:hypothetical protein
VIIRRNRQHPPGSLQDRLFKMASIAREKAKTYPPGPERETLLQKAEQSERCAALDEWIKTAGSPPPK